MRLLLVEDDKLLGEGIYTGLCQEGYAVDWVRDGEAAEAACLSEEYDCMVLDIGLPRQNGLQVLERVRARGKDTPVLMLTARDTIADRVTGLDHGADDYMVKPFDLEELHARLRAMLRRRAGRTSPLLIYGDIELDPVAHCVKKAGERVELSPKGFSILQTLLENKGRVMSRTRLEESLYSWKDEIESNAVEVHIHHLRKKLGSDLIRTIRGVGYSIG
ncbi:MAG TPA: response regulator [Gammaproteobacteria bacterium]|nr:response regulator [Gammaproteobacteria bacterium]